ncbi:TPA: helix-turn-helix domain-containing protein [Vibrio parahaemolyticus]|nr:helix-turn-helix domain-containing protein [Vibrio parahaemolyticus]
MIYNHCVACSATENLEQHHVVPRSMFKTDADYNLEKNLITVCSRCHGLLHGSYRGKRWSNDHAELRRRGVEKAKAAGKFKGGAKRIDRRSVFKCLDDGMSVRKTAEHLGIAPATVQRIKKEKGM